MWKAAFRSLRERKLRLLLTSLSIAIGVAFIAGTFVLTDSIEDAFDEIFTESLAGIDLVVRTKPAFAEGERPRVSEEVLAKVRSVEGVAAASGTIEALGTLIDDKGERVETQAPVFVFGYAESDKLNNFDLATGKLPKGEGELAVDLDSSKRNKWKLGQEVRVLIGTAVRPLKITGVIEFKGFRTFGATLLMIDPKAAQSFLGWGPTYTSIAVSQSAPTSDPQLKTRIQRALPAEYEVSSANSLAQEAKDDIQEGLRFITTALLVFAGVALFAGSFLIFNTFSILFAQRLREFAMLRAIGALPRQVLTVVVAESLTIGAISSALGLVLGVALAKGLQELIEALGGSIPAAGTPLLPRTIVASVVSGVLVTTASAFLPAFRASRIPPLAAIREGAALRPKKSRLRRNLAAAVLGALGIGAMIFALIGGQRDFFPGAGQVFALLGTGMTLIFVATAMAMPSAVGPLGMSLGYPFARTAGVTANIARGNAVRDPNRTAATASALMLGVALVSFVAIYASSVRESASRDLERRLRADYVLFGGRHADDKIDDQIRELPEIEEAAGAQLGPTNVDGRPAGALMVHPERMERLFFFDVSEGSLTDLSTGILIYEEFAKNRRLSTGDQVKVEFPTGGSESVVVKGIFRLRPNSRANFDGSHVYTVDYLLSTDRFSEKFIDKHDHIIFAARAPGVGLDAGKTAIEKSISANPAVQVFDQADLRVRVDESISGLLRLVNGLLGLALLVGVLGIVNTLVLSVIERTREIGLLRAIGVTRRQIRSIVRWESVIVTTIGALSGLVLGALFAWLTITGQPEQRLAFSLPAGRIAFYASISIVAGMLAATLPARRAARVDVLRAIAFE